jgi:hypothetical protein
MDQGETVTVFNDMAVFAPAALVDAPVTWTRLDEHRVRGVFTNGSQTVSAVLTFDADGDLVDFVSDDRLAASQDGRSFSAQRWSTPLAGYRERGGRRVATAGEGRWHAPQPDGTFTYIELHLDDIAYNRGVRSPGGTVEEVVPAPAQARPDASPVHSEHDGGLSESGAGMVE